MTESAALRLAALAAAVTGTLLFGINLLGFVSPMRAAEIDGYRDFAGGETLPFEVAVERLETLSGTAEGREALVAEATRVFHEGIAHVDPDDVAAKGFEHYGMRVPVTENWVLFLLSYLKPDTYRDYEFCHYRRALERGTGRCGQQSLALVSWLSAQGIETGFVALEGHAIVTARVEESRWYLLDPDYGAVIPFGLAEAEKNPESVLPHYWSPAARENRIDRLYATPNEVKYGGPEVRYARACPIETAAYVFKWAVPLVLLLPMPVMAGRRKIKGTG